MKTTDMNKKESREDYLEAILQLINEGKNPKSIDVANKLGFSKPSVSIAVKKLKQEGLLYVEDDGELVLSEPGLRIAENTLEKHEYLTALFIKIGVDPRSAEDQACEIEHAINEETFQKLKQFLDK